jgi:hypothetical protein
MVKIGKLVQKFKNPFFGMVSLKNVLNFPKGDLNYHSNQIFFPNLISR